MSGVEAIITLTPDEMLSCFVILLLTFDSFSIFHLLMFIGTSIGAYTRLKKIKALTTPLWPPLVFLDIISVLLIIFRGLIAVSSFFMLTQALLCPWSGEAVCALGLLCHVICTIERCESVDSMPRAHVMHCFFLFVY